MTAAGETTRPGVGKRPDRQEEALRENLKRRKAQARRRSSGETDAAAGAAPGDGEDSAPAAGGRPTADDIPGS